MNNNAVVFRSNNGKWLWFDDLIEIVRADQPADVETALRTVDDAVARGCYAAGFLTYEAATGLDVALSAHPPDHGPLLWFGLYGKPREYETLPVPEDSFQVGDWLSTVSEKDYRCALNRIRDYIAAGDTYQVNYTLRLRSDFEGDPYAFFHVLCRAQQPGHGAFVLTEEQALCSASPELFFCCENERIFSRPMKGTGPRGCTLEEDNRSAQALSVSEKNRAENIMIVDMIRNDLGRIAEAGTVYVTSSFDVERYPTILQMTSTVEAQTRASFPDMMKALFPCASITGAPKVRTMAIIKELESTPRGIYTGSIGYLAPEDKPDGMASSEFNVAIRTVVIDRKKGAAEYGAGGGIVWDSDITGEYEECLAKAKILTTRIPAFELLETLLWRPDEGFFLDEEHLKRIQDSAAYFGFVFDRETVAYALGECGDRLPRIPHRIRMRLAEDGTLSLDSYAESIVSKPEVRQVGLAEFPIHSRNNFLYHKTTHREMYQKARDTRPDCDDVLLYNERGEVTEATIANLIWEEEGDFFTPPVSSGLLAGTFRNHLLEQGKVKERILPVDSLSSCNKLFLVNSVRKWIPAVYRAF